MKHTPVLLKETLEFLNVKKGGKYIDATFGGGGHGEEILERGGKLLGIDWDSESLELAKRKMENREWRIDRDFILVNANFRDIERVAKDNEFYPVDGILFDLGISSIQLDEGGRGFSFQEDAPLDMRINRDELGVTAADLVNGLREDQLFELFSQTCEERVARSVSRTIVSTRNLKRIETTGELTDIVNRAYRGRERKISPATTIFLALRTAVNSELENLKEGLAGALEILNEGGRLVVISFHSGEDRIVKDFIKAKSEEGKVKNLTVKPMIPGEEEVRNNPRARSAKLRAGEKVC